MRVITLMAVAALLASCGDDLSARADVGAAAHGLAGSAGAEDGNPTERTFRDWLAGLWPFQNIAWPGRGQAW